MFLLDLSKYVFLCIPLHEDTDQLLVFCTSFHALPFNINPHRNVYRLYRVYRQMDLLPLRFSDGNNAIPPHSHDLEHQVDGYFGVRTDASTDEYLDLLCCESIIRPIL